MDPKLEEVFKLSGIPTYTFVKPDEYERLKVDIRTPGRGVVIEGPSGIGKTTAVQQVIDEIGLKKEALVLSARDKDEIEYIRSIPEIENHGLVIIDDFHRLQQDTQEKLSNHLKLLADEEREDSKLVLVGINKAGQKLVDFGHDLGTRVSIIKFEANSDDKIENLIEKGEDALNIEIPIRDSIIEEAQGGFYIAQYLCQQACIQEGITEKQEENKEISINYDVLREKALSDLSNKFDDISIEFARGKKLRPEGRAPYLHILKWLSESERWSINLTDEIALHSELKNSVGQVVNKGYLKELIEEKQNLEDVFHYDNKSTILSVEDPQYIFYIRNIPWNNFAKRAGYTKTYFDSKYDIALSFAGPNRKEAEKLFKELDKREIEVFYDKNEQHNILAEDVEEYLGPIYNSEAKYVVCLLGPDYPNRIWTKFESDQFRHRFGQNSVIPIFFEDAQKGIFDRSTNVGGLSYDPSGDTEAQMEEIAEIISERIRSDRIEDITKN